MSSHLPAAGEIVLMDRSWYNRAGVERVMGFCTEDEYQEFLRACPEFERMLLRSGIILIKYWFSVSDAEQERRFQRRIQDPTRRWKLSPMDLKSREMWVEYSRAKDNMFHYTDTKQSPWWVVVADDKRRARLNCISHLLEQIPYGDLTPEPIKLPPRRDDTRLCPAAHERPDLRSRPLRLRGRPVASIASRRRRRRGPAEGAPGRLPPAAAASRSRTTATATALDYPDVAAEVAEAVARGEHDRALLVCGTGLGMAIAANKVPGVRAATAHDPYSAERARKSNNAQVLTMGARVIAPEDRREGPRPLAHRRVRARPLLPQGRQARGPGRRVTGRQATRAACLARRRP